MSLARNMRRYERKGKNGPVTLDEMLFGTLAAPNDECADERRRLLNTFREMMAMIEANAVATLAFLREERAKYDAEKDGPSAAMSMLDSIDALREVEAEMRQEKTNGSRDNPTVQ